MVSLAQAMHIGKDMKTLTTKQLKEMSRVQLLEVGKDIDYKVGVRSRAFRAAWFLADHGLESSKGCSWADGTISHLFGSK